MELKIDTIYYLENPEDGISKFATGSQLRYGDIVKEVFGVADINDLLMMIQYNKSFQECICKAHGVTEDQIKLELIFRVASDEDLQQLKDNTLGQNNEGEILVKE
ncbi:MULTISPECIES: hypothetical protein [Metabacillus]|jgi:hypothetical protein|uniref:Uncharacterized protein n=1 Tax=Metabacillus rhizolycopersici TaxID=2875709 RepID=A0ABS7UQI4_9BACI|nr:MULTISPECIES: hypothetical protein [Metabacillus]MBZ5750563.1 hypothetical protein [Metabacillus rhizolycopersici]MCM3651703.1 hypothetical protein [Metabacillus litoralis]